MICLFGSLRKVAYLKYAFYFFDDLRRFNKIELNSLEKSNRQTTVKQQNLNFTISCGMLLVFKI